MKSLRLALALLAVPVISFAQYTLSGNVATSTRQPLAGAHVQIVGTYLSAASDQSGNFRFQNLKSGDYKIVTSFVGFKTDTLLLRLVKSTEVNIELEEAAILQDEVVITATRAGRLTPVAHEEISSSKLSMVNFGQDLPVLIGSSISTVTTSDAGNGMGYTALRIRGTDMTRINVTINGIPLNDPESHNVFWVDLPDFASSTDNIQLQRGIGTSTNGAAAFGASINLQSIHLKTEPYANMSLSAGSFNTLKNSLTFGSGLINKHFTFDGRISKLSSDGYIDRASAELLSYYLSGAYTSSNDLLRFNIFSGKEKTYQAWDGVPSGILDTNRTYNGMGAYTDIRGNLHYYDNETDNYTQTHYQALYSHRFKSKLLLNMALHHTTGAGYYEQYRDNDKLQNYGIGQIVIGTPYYIAGTDTIATPGGVIERADLIRQKHLANTFSGATWSLNHQASRFESSIGGSWSAYKGNHFGRVIWSEFAGNTAINHEWYRSKADKNDMNLFAKTQFSINQKLKLWGDLQWRHIVYTIKGIDDDGRDISQSHTLNFFNPKAGISIITSRNQSMFASFGMAGREPNRDNYVDADPAKPGPRPETLYDFEVGYAYNGDKLAFSTNAYYMYYNDQLVLTGAINDVGAPVMVNVPSSYRTGAELAAKILISKSLKWESSLTLSQNRIKSFTEFVDNWDTWEQESVAHNNNTIAFSPALSGNSHFTWSPAKYVDFALISKYVGKQYIDNTQSDERKLNAYLVNDLLIKFTLKPGFVDSVGISLMINNLLNEKYESNAWVYRYVYDGRYEKLDGYFPQAGINMMAGLNVAF